MVSVPVITGNIDNSFLLNQVIKDQTTEVAKINICPRVSVPEIDLRVSYAMYEYSG